MGQEKAERLLACYDQSSKKFSRTQRRIKLYVIFSHPTFVLPLLSVNVQDPSAFDDEHLLQSL